MEKPSNDFLNFGKSNRNGAANLRGESQFLDTGDWPLRGRRKRVSAGGDAPTRRPIFVPRFAPIERTARSRPYPVSRPSQNDRLSRRRFRTSFCPYISDCCLGQKDGGKKMIQTLWARSDPIAFPGSIQNSRGRHGKRRGIAIPNFFHGYASITSRLSASNPVASLRGRTERSTCAPARKSRQIKVRRVRASGAGWPVRADTPPVYSWY